LQFGQNDLGKTIFIFLLLLGLNLNIKEDAKLPKDKKIIEKRINSIDVKDSKLFI
jgi:hypothetical protein